MTQAFFPLHSHSHYSLLDGLSQPKQIAERLAQCGHAGSALTDHGSVAGSIQFIKALQGACACGHQKNTHGANGCHIKGCQCTGFAKRPLKPILGCEFYLCEQDASIHESSNGKLSHLCVLAKNLDGWKSLLRATSAANSPNFFYRRPRLDLERLAAFSGGNFVTFSGHPGSDLANVLFGDIRGAYSARNHEAAQSYLHPDAYLRACNLAGRYRELFGRENFFLEIQLIDQDNLPAANVIAEILRKVGKDAGIPCVATADSHYPTQEHAIDQRVILCAALETNLQEIEQKMAAQEDVTLGGFFKSNRYHIPTLEEMVELHTPEELANSLHIAEMCEEYDVLRKPFLPTFECPDSLSPDEYMKRLCVQGWNQKIASRARNGQVEHTAHDGGSKTLREYAERIKRELAVITEAGLASYFLIVQDYCQWALNQGWLVGKGRGSAAGCLVSYLINITDVDPIEYGLLFERFYNAGRNAPGRIAFPDIDTDFPITRRDQVKQYIRRKYGESRVSDMVTFGRMQGRGALKDVLRAHGNISYDEMNRITSPIPDEAAIADQLQEIREEYGEASIIKWTLQNDAAALKEWAWLDEHDEVQGPLSLLFRQAIRLEGTKRSQGKHASGVVISPVDLADVAPLLHDKSSGGTVAGFEMNDLEATGSLKFDVLGVRVLDKIAGAMDIIATGEIAP